VTSAGAHGPIAEVAVLGAGLTGVAVALELARSGTRVALIEQDERAINRASLRNEGKIHLGFVFSQDTTMASSRLQLDGALQFRAILSRLTDGRTDALLTSQPFTYLVPRDTIATVDELTQRFAALDAMYREEIARDPGRDYLGRRPHSIVGRTSLSSLPHIRPDGFIAAFQTQEVAIDTRELAGILQAAVSMHPNIDFRPLHTVTSVERTCGGFSVNGVARGGEFRLASEQVVNALWENRFKIDRTAGMEHEPGWLHRLKYRVIARLPRRLRNGPSTTLVVGPYGDVVVRADETAYLSWYPLGLRGWSTALAPPDSWNAPCRGELPERDRAAVAAAVLEAIDEWYPGIADATPLAVDAGAIVAYGRTDVGDPASGLHDRTHVGVTSSNGYHSVDPGKLTTAPLFGVRAARAVLAERIAV
jgi:glycine/D-amino acid oxidase-like deaminating enzyme